MNEFVKKAGVDEVPVNGHPIRLRPFKLNKSAFDVGISDVLKEFVERRPWPTGLRLLWHIEKDTEMMYVGVEPGSPFTVVTAGNRITVGLPKKVLMCLQKTKKGMRWRSVAPMSEEEYGARPDLVVTNTELTSETVGSLLGNKLGRVGRYVYMPASTEQPLPAEGTIESRETTLVWLLARVFMPEKFGLDPEARPLKS